MGNSSGTVEPIVLPPRRKFSLEQQERMDRLKTQGNLDIECLAFEGGGVKATAYVGAAQVLEELGVLSRVHRFAGTSGGALFAVLLAIRLPLEEIRTILDSQSEDWIQDASMLSLVPNLLRKFGWNAETKMEEILRVIINQQFTSELSEKQKLAGRDEVFVTFMDIYKKFGTELCVMSTNISTMGAQYHHPKTTPNQSVVKAIIASTAIPVFCQPVAMKSQYFVDGGVLMNFPLHVYDGWYLSMKPGESFFHKAREARTAFSEHNEKTLGFILTSMGEKCGIRDMVVASDINGRDVSNVHFPDTALKRSRDDKITLTIQTQQNEASLVMVADHFLEIFKGARISEENKISRTDFETAYNKNPLSKEEEELLFGEEQTVQTIFRELDKTPDDELTFSEFLCAMQERGAIFGSKLDTYFPSDVSNIANVKQFLTLLFETLHCFTATAQFNARDVERTVNIETWYVQSLDLKLDPEDRDFLVQQGVNACLDYMERRQQGNLNT